MITKMRGKITISDVAEVVGVSASTVSHAISGKRPISEEVKQRIFAAVDELGYQPNYFAKSIKDKRTMLVGILIDHCQNPITGQLLDRIEVYLSQHSYEIVLGIAGRDVEKGRKLIRKFSSGMVDGIINMLPQLDCEEAETLAQGVPTVTHLRNPCAPIIIDYDAAEIEAMEYLFGMGHRKIGYIGSTLRSIPDRERMETLCRRLYNSHDLPFSEKFVAIGEDDITSGRRRAPELLKQGVTAILCANDQMALGVYEYAYSIGMKIPDELSVIGFDDSQFSTLVLPQLTTVRLPLDEMAAYTVENFLRCLNGDSAVRETKVINPKLIIRNSAGTIKKVKTGE